MPNLIKRKTAGGFSLILSILIFSESIVFASGENFIKLRENRSHLSPPLVININPLKTGFKTSFADFSNQRFGLANPRELFEFYEISNYLEPKCCLYFQPEEIEKRKKRKEAGKGKYVIKTDATENGEYFADLFFNLRNKFIKREKSLEIVLSGFTEKKLVTLAGLRLLENVNLYNVWDPINQIFPRILPDGTLLWSEQLFANKKIDNELKLFCYVYAVNRLYFHTRSQSIGRTLLYFQELTFKQQEIIIKALEKMSVNDGQVKALLRLVKKYQTLTLTQKIQKDFERFLKGSIDDFLEIIGLVQSSSGKITPPEMKADIHDFLNIEDSDVISQDGTRIHYIYGGNKKSAATLFFLHGITQNSTTWRTTLSWFEDWTKIVTMDGRGHGKSGPSQDKNNPDIRNAIRDLKAVTKKLHLENVITIGYSKGGLEISHLPQLTQNFEFQNFVDGLVLISTTFLNPFRSFFGNWSEKQAETIYRLLVNFLSKLASEKKGIISKRINEFMIFSYRYTYLRKAIEYFVAKTIFNPDLKFAAIDYLENFAATPLWEIIGRLHALRKVDNLYRLPEISVPTHWIYGDGDGLISPLAQEVQIKRIKKEMISVDFVEGNARHAPLIINLKDRVKGINEFLLERVYPRICLRYLSEILTQTDIPGSVIMDNLHNLVMFENLVLTKRKSGLKPILEKYNLNDIDNLDKVRKTLLRAKGNDAQKLKALFRQRQSEKILISQLRKTFNILYQHKDNVYSINKDKLLSELEKNTKGLSDLVVDSWNEKKWGDILSIIKKYFYQAEIVSNFAVLNAKGEYEGISEQQCLSFFAQGWLNILETNETIKDLYVADCFLGCQPESNTFGTKLISQSI